MFVVSCCFHNTQVEQARKVKRFIQDPTQEVNYMYMYSRIVEMQASRVNLSGLKFVFEWVMCPYACTIHVLWTRAENMCCSVSLPPQISSHWSSLLLAPLTVPLSHYLSILSYGCAWLSLACWSLSSSCCLISISSCCSSLSVEHLTASLFCCLYSFLLPCSLHLLHAHNSVIPSSFQLALAVNMHAYTRSPRPQW